MADDRAPPPVDAPPVDNPVEDEFAFIRHRLAPLTRGVPGAFGLSDDAALVEAGPLVISADMLVGGVHFLQDDPLDLVARKALRVNLSDLAAKGAQPLGYFLSMAWPRSAAAAHRARFADGLAVDGAMFSVPLLGGDTTATDGPLTIAITMLGRPGPRGMVRRAGAQPGEQVYVAGVIGDGGLGLAARRGELGERLHAEHIEALIAAYQRPDPPVAATDLIAAWASAALDVSDGLLADAMHLARASDVTLVLEAEAIPVSPAGAAWLQHQSARDAALVRLAISGDDYALLFCAPAPTADALSAAADAAGVRLTRIGRVEPGASEGPQAQFLNAAGENLTPKRAGFTHF